MKLLTINEDKVKFRQEPFFSIFKHTELICCIQRFPAFGSYNAYVGIPAGHPFYGKDWNYKVKASLDEVKFNGNYMALLCSALGSEDFEEEVPLSLFLQCHGGVTYAKTCCPGIDQDVIGDLWWFGFDTAHAGDYKVFETDIDRKYPIYNEDEPYRDFDYVKNEVKKLAEQLAKLGGQ
jgi:hypothetical protein